MKTTTRKQPGAAPADTAVLPPPARTKVSPPPQTAGTPPADAGWQRSISAASESTLRHLVHSGEAANFQGVSSGTPRLS